MHVGYKLHKICDSLLKNGFNEVYIEEIQKECIWNREYGIVCIGWAFYDVFDIPNHEYVTIEFNYQQFFKDLKDYFQRQFPKCKINFNMSNYGELEIVGRNYSIYYLEIEDKWERAAERDDLEGGVILENITLKEDISQAKEDYGPWD